MAQTGYTIVQLYRSSTPSAVPAAIDLAPGELAINLADKKLYAKDSSGSVFVLADASSTGTGSVVKQTSPSIITPLILGGLTEDNITSNTGSSFTVTFDNGSVQFLTLTASCSFTFPTATAGKSLTLHLKQDGVGGRTATWPASVKWPASTSPTLTSTAGKVDIFTFSANGTSWFGSIFGQNY